MASSIVVKRGVNLVLREEFLALKHENKLVGGAYLQEAGRNESHDIIFLYNDKYYIELVFHNPKAGNPKYHVSPNFSINKLNSHGVYVETLDEAMQEITKWENGEAVPLCDNKPLMYLV